MQVNNPEQWSLQLKAFQQDETGRQFAEYMSFWCEAAEKIMEESDTSPYEAFQAALQITEENIGRMDASTFLGKMLVYIVAHWRYGSEIAEQFTSVELKITASAVEEKQVALQAMAEANTQAAE